MAKRGRPPINRPNETENNENGQNTGSSLEKEPKTDKKDGFMTPFEAAEYFRTTEATIKLWVSHRILEQVRGGLIPMRSIRKCKFDTRRIQ